MFGTYLSYVGKLKGPRGKKHFLVQFIAFFALIPKI